MKSSAAFTGEVYDEYLKKCRSCGWGIHVEGESTWLQYAISNKINDKIKLLILNNFWHRYKTETSRGSNISTFIKRLPDNKIQIHIQSNSTQAITKDEFSLAILFSSHTHKKYGLS